VQVVCSGTCSVHISDFVVKGDISPCIEAKALLLVINMKQIQAWIILMYQRILLNS